MVIKFVKKNEWGEGIVLCCLGMLEKVMLLSNIRVEMWMKWGIKSYVLLREEYCSLESSWCKGLMC